MTSSPDLQAIPIDASAATWQRFGEQILHIESTAYSPDDIYPEGTLRSFFETYSSVIVLLLLKEELIGYSVARPVGAIWPKRSDEDDTYNITFTVIKLEHQGKGYVGRIMEVMEDVLRGKKAKFVERNAAVGNGYNAKIAQHYGDRVLVTGPIQESPYGKQQFFRIRL